jgi:hypothetical protein
MWSRDMHAARSPSPCPEAGWGMGLHPAARLPSSCSSPSSPANPSHSSSATPTTARPLPQEYGAITPGYHIKKHHWITLHGGRDITSKLVKDPPDAPTAEASRDTAVEAVTGP